MENNNKKYYITTIIPLLLLLAAAFFVLKTVIDRQDIYRPDAKEIGYIDANAVYRSSKSYRIAKKEIDEYASRINRELARALANEKNADRRQQLKREASKEIALYANALLQDIDKDIDDAINVVADSKNLKRVYVSGANKRGVKNVTDAVITELHQTISGRLASYLEEAGSSNKAEYENRVWQKQFNFNAYPVANVPEKGITVNFSGRLIKITNSKGAIVAGTLSPEMDPNERFLWQRANWTRPAKKAETANCISKNKHNNIAFVKIANIQLLTGKTDEIIHGCMDVAAFINARNQVLVRTEIATISKEMPKTVVHVMPQKNLAEIPCAKIEIPENKSDQIIAVSQQAALDAADFVQNRNVQLTELMSQKGNVKKEKIVVQELQQKALSEIPCVKIETAKDKRQQIVSAAQYATACAVSFAQERYAQIAKIMRQKENGAANNSAMKKQITPKNPAIEKPSCKITLHAGHITLEHLGVFLNLVGSKIYTLNILFKEHWAKSAPLIQNGIANISAGTILRLEKIRDIKPEATVMKKQTVTVKTVQPSVPAAKITIPEGKTDKIIIACNTVANINKSLKNIGSERKEELNTDKTALKQKAVEVKTEQRMAEENNTNAQKQPQKEIPAAEQVTKTAEEKTLSNTEPASSGKTLVKAATDMLERQETAKQQKTEAENKRVKLVTIQVAACRNRSGAENAVRNIQNKKMPVFMRAEISRDGLQWWCVRVTAQNETEEGLYMKKLTAMGYSPFVLLRK